MRYYIESTAVPPGHGYCAMWWDPRLGTVTPDLGRAGLFEYSDALSFCDSNKWARAWPQDLVDQCRASHVSYLRLRCKGDSLPWSISLGG